MSPESSISLAKVLEASPVRVRVALVLAVGEYAMELPPHGQGVGLAREGLDASWEWVRRGGKSAEELHDYVEGGGGGLLCLASMAIANKTSEEPVLQVTATCIAYAAHEAYLQAGQNLPETIELATAEAVEDIIEMYLVRVPGYQQAFFDRIAEYLLAHFNTGEGRKGRAVKGSGIFEGRPSRGREGGRLS